MFIFYNLFILDIEETILEDPLEDYILINDVLPISLALVVVIFIILLFVFAIIRFTKCEHCIMYVINKYSKRIVTTHDECSVENHNIDGEADSDSEYYISDGKLVMDTDSVISDCFKEGISDNYCLFDDTICQNNAEQMISRQS